MKRFFIFLLSLLVISSSASAQNKIRVEVPNIVASDEQFNVTFIIEGENEPSDFNWAPGDDFQLVWGPQKGSSTSIQIINGKRSKSSQTTYTYVLMPKTTGTFRVAVATATVKGHKISSENVSVQVATGQTSSQSSGSSSSSGSGASSSSKSASSTGSISNSDLFLRLSLSKTKVVLGEPINATLKLYQRVDIAGFENAKFPTFNGFWSQEVQAPTNIQFQREEIDGKLYNSALIRGYVLIPQQAGSIKIDPAELVCLVNVRTGSSSGNSIFDSFFQDDYTTIRKRVVSEAHTIHVSALPSGAPASFGGGVGNFTISASLSKDSIKTHDAVSLLVKISGNGNVSLLEAPKVSFPADFEVYDAKSTQNTNKSGTSGSKTFEFPFIPRSHGDFTIEPIEYAYYDIAAGKYVVTRTSPINLKVAKGSAPDGQVSRGTMTSGVTRNDVKSLGNDIRFIQTKMPSFSSKGVFFFGSAFFWALLALIILLSAGCWFFVRKYAVRRADVIGNKNRKATKMALKRLKQAEDYLKKNLYTAFYEELHRALLGFVSDKFNLPVEDLSSEKISETLLNQGVSQELSDEFTSLLGACEYARYAPDAGHEAMSAHFDTAVKVISTMDSVIKKSGGAGKATVMVALALLSLPGVSKAAQKDYLDSLWTKGVTEYNAGDWKGAVKSWDSVEKTGVESAVLYYNMANAYFKAEDYPHSILFYEKALKTDPSFSDARYNLEFANTFVQDKIDPVPEFILKSLSRKLCYTMSSNTWAVLALVFFALSFGAVVLFLLSHRIGGRRTGFYSAIVLVLFALGSFTFASWQKSTYLKSDTAVIMNPVVSAKSSPSEESSKDLFVLHEGTKVKLLDEVGDWNNVELADGRQGWIKKADIEII